MDSVPAVRHLQLELICRYSQENCQRPVYSHVQCVGAAVFGGVLLV